MNDEIKESIDRNLKNRLGISYDEFFELSYEEQERVINEYQKKNSIKKKSDTTVMIGSGEDAMFLKVEKGTRVMLEDGTFIRVGKTLEESIKEIEDRSDDVIYSKPVAFMKKLVRRIKR